MKVSTSQLILSCEHGGNRIPAIYRYLFRNATHVINTHRGLDIGALSIAKAIARGLSAPLLYSETSRLLVDLNRSPQHRNLFSEFTRDCDTQIREAILRKYYYPYRQILKQQILDTIADKRMVLHISIHSFTPVLGGQVRNADVGLLYDPTRKKEKAFCLHLQSQLQTAGLHTRRNYPYRGAGDGFTTWLRKTLPEKCYLGIEIEINQKLLGGDSKLIGKQLVAALRSPVYGLLNL